MIEEIIEFYGHPLIKATHKNTIEITRENILTQNGNCIIGVNASKSCKNLGNNIKEQLKNDNNQVIIILKVNEMKCIINGTGSQQLTLDDMNDIVMRKSQFISSRTLAINCNKAALDIPRKMISKLKNHNANGKLIIQVSSDKCNIKW